MELEIEAARSNEAGNNEAFEHLIAEMVEHARRIMDMSSVHDLRWTERLHSQIEHHYSKVYHILATTQNLET